MSKWTRRNISSLIFSKPSRLLNEINANAKMLQWSRENPTENVFKKRFDLHEHVNNLVGSNTKIDYLEVGVSRGESIKRWAKNNICPESRFYDFDSFEGLPEQWESGRNAGPKGTFDVGGNLPKTDDKGVKFIKGWFQDTLDSFLDSYKPDGKLIIHNDSDIYSATLYCLTKLDKILVPGSIIIFDEFYSSSNEFSAFLDYTRSYNRTYKLLGSVGSNPYVRTALEMK